MPVMPGKLVNSRPGAYLPLHASLCKSVPEFSEFFLHSEKGEACS